MSDFIADIIQYDFLRNALWASICLGVICGIVGVYVVIRRLVFLSGGVTHASFGGIGIAYYLGIEPIWGALLFSVASLLGMEGMTSVMKIREDSAIGVLWALGMAVGIVFIFLTPGYTPNLMSFLFGNVLTVTSSVLTANIVLSVVLLLLFALFHRIILFTAFDPGFAATQQIAVRTINRMAMVLIAVSIVLTIKLAGIMLLVSMLTLPPITANLLTSSYPRMTLLSIVITVVCNIIGLFVSYKSALPGSAAIILVMVLLYVIVRMVKVVITKISISKGLLRE